MRTDAASRPPPFPLRSWWTFLLFQVTAVAMFATFMVESAWGIPPWAAWSLRLLAAAGLGGLLLVGPEGRRFVALLVLFVIVWWAPGALGFEGRAWPLAFVLVALLEVGAVEMFRRIRRRRATLSNDRDDAGEVFD